MSKALRAAEKFNREMELVEHVLGPKPTTKDKKRIDLLARKLLIRCLMEGATMKEIEAFVDKPMEVCGD